MKCWEINEYYIFSFLYNKYVGLSLLRVLRFPHPAQKGIQVRLFGDSWSNVSAPVIDWRPVRCQLWSAQAPPRPCKQDER